MPTLRHLDPDLGGIGESFVLEQATNQGNPDGGVVCATQGFGGWNGALALRGAHAEAFKRYSVDRNVLAAYLERWPELRREREQRERLLAHASAQRARARANASLERIGLRSCQTLATIGSAR